MNRALRVGFTALVAAGCPSPPPVPPGPHCAPTVVTFPGGQVSSFPVPSSAGPGVLADVDGDGQPDLLFTLQTGLTLMHGDRGGGFTPVDTFGLDPYGMVGAADLDGDGRADAVVTDASTDELVVKLSRGGRLEDSQSLALPPSGSSAPPRFRLADVDGDGAVDVVYATPDAPSFSPKVTVFYGDGHGHLAPGVPAGIDVALLDFQLVDLRGDGRIALVGLDWPQSDLVVYERGSARGDWTQTAFLFTVTAPNAELIAADFNGDGAIDLCRVDLGRGVVNVAFGPAYDTLGASQSAGSKGLFGAVAGNFAGAGHADLAVTTSGGFGLMLNDGNGNLTAGPVVSLGADDASANAPVAADLDGDGLTDVVVTASDGTAVSVLARIGLGAQEIYPVAAGATSLVAADMDNDGWPDLLMAHPTLTTVTLLHNQSGLSFHSGTLNAISGVISLAVGDFDGDGTNDLVFSQSDALTLFLQSQGTFKEVPNTLPAPARETTTLAAADVDGDGRLDLLGVDGVQGLSWWLNNGADGFGGQQSIPAAGSAGLAVADLNGDGRPDAVAVGSGGAQAFFNSWGGGADGGFFPGPVFGTSGLDSVAVGDVNGDGHPDVVTGDISGRVAVWVSEGAGFRPGFQSAPSGNPTLVALADLRGNGVLDVVSTDSAVGVLRVWLNDGTGQFSPGASYAVGVVAPGGLVAADINLDGRVDVVVADQSANAVRVLFNTCHP